MNYFTKRSATVLPLAMALVLQGLTVSAEDTEAMDILTAAIANESVMSGVDMTSSYNLDLVVSTGGSDVPLKLNGTVDIKSTPANGEMQVTQNANQNIMGEDTSNTTDRYYITDGEDGLKEYICSDGMLWSIGDGSLYQLFEAVMTTDPVYISGLDWSLDSQTTDITGGNDCYVLRTTIQADELFSKSKIGRISEDDEFNTAFQSGLAGITANMIYYVDEDTYLPMLLQVDLNTSDLSTLGYSLVNYYLGGGVDTVSVRNNDCSFEGWYLYGDAEDIVVPDEGLEALGVEPGDALIDPDDIPTSEDGVQTPVQEPVELPSDVVVDSDTNFPGSDWSETEAPNYHVPEVGTGDDSEYMPKELVVGTDIREGDYFATYKDNPYMKGDKGIISITGKDTQGVNRTHVYSFNTNHMFRVKDGDTLRVYNLSLSPYTRKESVDTKSEGMFEVGTHIKSGFYSIRKSNDSNKYGMYCVMNSLTDEVIYDMFHTSATVYLKDGQYLVLDGAVINGYKAN